MAKIRMSHHKNKIVLGLAISILFHAGLALYFTLNAQDPAKSDLADGQAAIQGTSIVLGDSAQLQTDMVEAPHMPSQPAPPVLPVAPTPPKQKIPKVVKAIKPQLPAVLPVKTAIEDVAGEEKTDLMTEKVEAPQEPAFDIAAMESPVEDPSAVFEETAPAKDATEAGLHSVTQEVVEPVSVQAGEEALGPQNHNSHSGAEVASGATSGANLGDTMSSDQEGGIAVTGNGGKLKVRRMVKPNYNVRDRLARKEGIVVLQYSINSDGVVEKVELLKSSEHKSLDEKSLDALKRTVYFPGQQGEYSITYEWKLSGNEELPMTLRRSRQ